MTNTAFNYVRTFRQRHCLSEAETAFLVDQRGHTMISKIEVGRKFPNLPTALALQVLFRQSPRALFPGLYEQVEEEVMRRAKAFLEDIEGRDDRRSQAKRDLLEGLARLDNEDDDL